MVSRFALKSFILSLVLCSTSAVIFSAEPTKYSAAEVASLIEKLGHDEFAERELAGETLVKIGLPAYKQVEAAIDHKDREIRYRAARIMTQIREADLARRLDAFLKGNDDAFEFPIPGWGAFKKAFADSSETRNIFVEMQRAEPELFETLENNRKDLNDVIAQRVLGIQQSMQFQQQQLKLGQVLAFVFVGTEAKGLQLQTSSMIQQFCYQQSFRDTITSSNRKEICKKILGAWITKAEDNLAYQAMMLAMQYEVTDGLIPAVKMLEGGNRQPHMAQYAALTIAKFGTAEQRPVLEKLLDDKTVVNQMQINNKRIQTQMGDVALACLVHLTKQDHKQYGFDRLQQAQPYLFNVGTIGFDDDTKRKAAIDKWNEFKKGESKDKGASAEKPATAKKEDK